MAKNSGIIQFTGKLGELVGAQGQDGRTIIRQRRYTIKNPRTDAQCAQRMIFATAGQAIAHLKPILNNSFEGKSFGAKSIQYARSLFLRMLRTAPTLGDNGMVYLPKGSLNFPVNPYVLSQGSLQDPGIVPNVPDGAFAVAANVPAGGLSTATASQLFKNVEVGHQITLVIVTSNEVSPKITVQIMRFAFKDDTIPALLAESGSSVFHLNPAAIDASLAEGKWGKLSFTMSENEVSIAPSISDEENAVAMGSIVSDKIGGKRSSSVLVVDSSATISNRGGVSAAGALPTYADGASSLNLPSDYYLQNSVSVAE